MKSARRFLALLGAAALLPLGATGAMAQASANDAKCFLVSNMFTKSTNAKAKQAAAEASFFYLGRLNGSATQLETLLAQQAKSINKSNATALMQGCAKTVAQRAAEIQTAGKRLSAAKSKMGPDSR